MRIAAALLESYERQVQSVEGALKVIATPKPHLYPSSPTLNTLVPVALQRSPKCRLAFLSERVYHCSHE